jgi:Ca2+/H+ antiporter
MKFMVRYLQSNSGIKLSSGVCVSRYFGFVIPTRVTLSYVIDENTFWMRIYPPLQPVKTEFPPEVIIMPLLFFCNNYSFIIIQYWSQYFQIHTHKETLKRKHQNDDQDEPNSKRCKRPKANKQAVYLKSPPPCQNSKNNDDQDEPNSKRCKKPRGNKQAVSLKSPPPCKKQKILKSTPKELSKQRHVSNKWIILVLSIILNILVILMILIFLKPNLKIRASERKKYLKSTPKKSNKQHQVSKKWMILIKYIYYTKNIILPLNDV